MEKDKKNRLFCKSTMIKYYKVNIDSHNLENLKNKI